MIRVGIDTKPLRTGHSVRGVGMYTKNLFKFLEQESKRAREQEVKIEAVDFTDPNNKLLITNYDLIHYPYFDLFYNTLPLVKKVKTVVTVHDVIPLVFPEHYPPGIKGFIKYQIQKFSLKGARAVITDSQNSKKDIFKYLNYPEEKIHVIYLAPGKKFKKLEIGNWKLEICKQYNLPDKFILYVGDVNWNKNVTGLIRACQKIKVPLVIVGKQAVSEDFDYRHPENKPLVELLNLAKNDKNIKRIGFIPDEDLVKVYNIATVYCQPSFYEGFGIPVLDAMACGCPVVSAGTSSLAEICQEAALKVDPYDYNDIADKLGNVFHNSKLRKDLVTKGLVQVKKFSWEKTARKTLGVYEQVVEEK